MRDRCDLPSELHMHAQCESFLARITFSPIFGTNHIQPNFLGLRLLWMYRFLSSSFSFLLLETVFLHTTLRTTKILPLFHYCFQCLSTHTWGKLLCENDPAHPLC